MELLLVVPAGAGGSMRWPPDMEGARVTGATSVALTLLDVLDSFQTIQLCTDYRIGGKIVHTVPVTRLLSSARPVYEEWDGWCEPITDVRRFEDLPLNA